MADTPHARTPRVAVVTPVHNKCELTLRYLESFGKSRYKNYTIVITDDGSTDGTAEQIARRFPEVVVLKGDGNLWWTEGTNVGVRYALANNYDYVLTINNDVIVDPDMLGELVAAAEANPRTIVGARNNYMEWPDKIFSVGARSEWHLLCPMHLNCCGVMEPDALPKLNKLSAVETLSGCGTLVPTQCFREVGLYDRRWCPQYHADSEFVLRAAKHGYGVLVNIDAVLWNDVKNTTSDWRFSSIRSVLYWRPNLALRWRYAPGRKMKLKSMWHFTRIALRTVIAARFRKLFRMPAIAYAPKN